MASYQRKKFRPYWNIRFLKKTPAKINCLMYEIHHTSQICMNGV
nr:hypothetical protein [Enterobacter asburiae]